jgi:hypothetical protein
MAFRRVLGHIDFSCLTESQKSDIKKIVQSRHRESAAEVKLVNRALAKKKKSKKKR